MGEYVNRMYLEWVVSASIISNANIALFLPPGGTTPVPASNIQENLVSESVTGWQTSQCRDFINNLAGSRRAFAHAQLYPGVGNLNDPMFGDYTQWQIEMGSDHIVFGSDSMWYGGPQWQIEALWRFQIPEQIQEQWGYPALTEKDRRNILGLNSARLYGLQGRQKMGIGVHGSAYKTGNLPGYPSFTQPGSPVDTVMTGVGYPTPVTPVTLIPNDNITKVKAHYAASGAGRSSNTPRGFIRTS